jgi:hypothetical protein
MAGKKPSASVSGTVLDQLFNAARENPAAVRAMLTIEMVNNPDPHFEREFLVDARVMTLLHDLVQALEDDHTGGNR